MKPQSGLSKIPGQPNSVITNLQGKGKGRIAVVIATGPSHKEAPLGELKGLPNVDCLSINQPDERVWPTKYWVLADRSMRVFFKDKLKDYEGTVISSHHPPEVPMKHVIRIKMLPDMLFARDAVNGIYSAKNSTYITMQIAHYCGYDRIYVFGMDMGAVDGQLYDKPHPWNDTRMRLLKFKAESDVLLHIAQFCMMDEEKAKFVLCSPYNKWDFAKLFRNLGPIEAVEEIKAWQATRNPTP